MKSLSIIIVIVLIGTFLWLSGFGQSKGPVRFAVRLDLVGLDGISRSGTSVWESKISANPFGGYHMTMRGEAIVVSDGAKGVYADLLRSTYNNGNIGSDQTVMLPEILFRDEARPYLRGSEVSDRVRVNRTIGQNPGWSKTMTYVEGLAAGHPLPFLVHLPDRTNPRGIVAATPNSEALGPNPRITITVTDAKVTTGIRKTLPWVHKKNSGNKMLDGERYDISQRSGLANRLGSGDFSSEAN